ncbi:hypothetical protein OAT39_03780 [Candidatus Thioglobus sp.]|nr:hypothetical protein [Candidatus Thioglobus sp.]
MSSSIVVTVVESPFFPDFSDLYDHKGLLESRVDSIRKAISLIKKQPAAYIVVEFFLCL